jgi:hypothetical protein
MAKKYKVVVYYESWTEEDKEIGATDDQGVEYEGKDTIEDIIHLAKKYNLDPSVDDRSWRSTYFEPATDYDFRSGKDTYYSMFVENLDGSQVSWKVFDEINTSIGGRPSGKNPGARKSKRWHKDPKLDTQMRKHYALLMKGLSDIPASDRSDYKAWAAEEVYSRAGFMDSYHNPGLGHGGRLGVKDKKVLKAFAKCKPAEGPKLWTDGKTLDGQWMGGSGIARWHKGKVYFQDLGSKAADMVQRAVSKHIAKSKLGGYAVFRRDLVDNPGKRLKARRKKAKAKYTERSRAGARAALGGAGGALVFGIPGAIAGAAIGAGTTPNPSKRGPKSEWNRRHLLIDEHIEPLSYWHGGQNSMVYSLMSTGMEGYVSQGMIQAAIDELEYDLRKAKKRPGGLSKSDIRELETLISDLQMIVIDPDSHSVEESGLETPDSWEYSTWIATRENPCHCKGKCSRCKKRKARRNPSKSTPVDKEVARFLREVQQRKLLRKGKKIRRNPTKKSAAKLKLEAFKLGVKGFKAGKKAPAQDKAFMDWAAKYQEAIGTNMGSLLPYLKLYNEGWHKTHREETDKQLKKDAPELWAGMVKAGLRKNPLKKKKAKAAKKKKASVKKKKGAAKRKKGSVKKPRRK